MIPITVTVGEASAYRGEPQHSTKPSKGQVKYSGYTKIGTGTK